MAKIKSWTEKEKSLLKKKCKEFLDADPDLKKYEVIEKLKPFFPDRSEGSLHDGIYRFHGLFTSERNTPQRVIVKMKSEKQIPAPETWII